ncbi:M16 family metallopeptidase [Fundidesulfovibrio terrae]|uniref:M16 family metallopeptidase n=1 Tax=Fundidesulfovibrio terrae TaxID=2922866 RepID=UPI001FAF684F|nr:pitrilysin family protein [Fundidesulfovibrio terrae]
MTRKLFGYLLVAAALIAGYISHDRISRNATGPDRSPTVVQAPAQVSPDAPGSPAPDAAAPATPAAPIGSQAPVPAGNVPVENGRLLAKLPNGLTVLVVEDKRFPLVAERLYVRAGSAYEAKGQEGLSHLLEHMVFNSTAKRPKGGVAGDIESAGGDTNASTSFDYTKYMADLPRAHWKLGLDVLQDMIFGAKFDASELEQEKKVVISELERGLDEPGQRLFQMSQGQVWAGLPYSHPVIGYRETVGAATSEDLRAYVKRLYQPQSMLLVVVGDVNAREVFNEAQNVFGSLTNDRSVVPPEVKDILPNTGGPTARAAGGNWNKCYLRLNFAVPGMHSAKDSPLEVLADLLGGLKTSRLYRSLVYEKQLADSLDVSTVGLERGGVLSLEATVDPAKLDAFWAALAHELAAFKAGDLSDAELERTKLGIEDAVYRSRETLSGVATSLAYYQFFGFGLEGVDNAVYEVRNTDRTQIQELLDTYLQPGNASLSLLLPGADQAGAEAKARAMTGELSRLWPAKASVAAAGQGGGAVSGPEVLDLGGGRTVVLLPDSTMPYAAVTLTYRGGDALLSPGEQGLAELAAKALTRSTRARDAVAMQDFLADRASSVGASSGRDTFTVSARYPARFAGDMDALMAEIVGEPAFSPQEVERAKKSQLAQIAEAEDRPSSLAFRNLFPFLYPGGHYGYFRAGQPDGVKRFEPDQAAAFWEKQRAMPWVLAVCGQFGREEVLALARKLAAWTGGAPPAFSSPSWSSEHALSLKLAERNQTHLFWVFPVEGRRSPDTPGLEVLRTALAGQGGLLFQDLRDKQGLGYSVSAMLWQAPETGFLVLYIGTTPDKEKQALDGFRRIASEVAAKGLDMDSVERAKSSLEGDYYQDRQSLGSRSQEAALNLSMGYPLDYERELLTKVAALGGEQVAAVAKKYLDPAKAYLLKVEP